MFGGTSLESIKANSFYGEVQPKRPIYGKQKARSVYQNSSKTKSALTSETVVETAKERHPSSWTIERIIHRFQTSTHPKRAVHTPFRSRRLKPPHSAATGRTFHFSGRHGHPESTRRCLQAKLGRKSAACHFLVKTHAEDISGHDHMLDRQGEQPGVSRSPCYICRTRSNAGMSVLPMSAWRVLMM